MITNMKTRWLTRPMLLPRISFFDCE